MSGIEGWEVPEAVGEKLRIRLVRAHLQGLFQLPKAAVVRLVMIL
jgi:hypothetical protein